MNRAPTHAWMGNARRAALRYDRIATRAQLALLPVMAAGLVWVFRFQLLAIFQ